ncbi:MAG: mechanosensitive ion channel domain-containing protein [Pseudomonadota bacterium]
MNPAEIDWNQLFVDYAIPWAIRITLALVIFVVGRWVRTIIVSLAKRVMAKAGQDPILINFVGSILSALLLLVVVVAALDQLGLNTTSIVAVLGAAGLAVGLALQDSLKNFAAGVMLIIFRPFKTGDFVEVAGVSGSVEELSVFWSKLKTPDNKAVTLPNGDVLAGPITNYSAKETRRVDMVFGIGYDDDIELAGRILKEIVTGHDKVLADPAPVVALHELADSSVNFVVRPWAKTSDYWAVYWDVHKQVKKRFDAEGVSIPYPQMDVHLDRTDNPEQVRAA